MSDMNLPEKQSGHSSDVGHIHSSLPMNSTHDHDHADRTAEDDVHAAAKAAAGSRDDRYWRSLEQWGQDPEFQKMAEAEFQSSPLRFEDDADGKKEGWARREFLKLMGASLAMSATGCIRRPVEKIVPYNKQPEEVTFNVDNNYTSVFSDGLDSQALLIRTREGRPLKVSGNLGSPTNKQGVSTRGQAHILSLYDPERLKTATKNIQRLEKNNPERNRSNRDTINIDWKSVDADVVKALAEGGVALLMPSLYSPSTNAVLNDFSVAFSAKIYNYDALSMNSVRQGQKESYGSLATPMYRFEKAKVILSVDGDFLGTYMTPTVSQREFAESRRDPATMNRLVTFESQYSVTGANSDIRVRIKPSQQIDVVMGIAHEIIVKKKATSFAGNAAVVSALQPFADVASKLNVEPALWARLAEDLIKNQGESVVIAGGLAAESSHALALQIAANFLNSALGNDGKAVNAGLAPEGLASSLGLAALLTAIDKGEVKTLIIHGQLNPVYSYANSKAVVDAFRKVKTIVSFADRNDETAIYADYVLPDHHSMEAWGDLELANGVFAIQQPTIRPLHETRSFQESLITWATAAGKGPARLTGSTTYYDYVRSYWKASIQPKVGGGKAFEDFWEAALQSGFVGEGKGNANSAARSFNVSALAQVKPVPATSGFELVLYPSSAFAEGTLSNVSWLCEFPDPISKICWDNYVSVSLATAHKENLKEGDHIRLTVGGVTIDAPVYVQPGLHDDVLAIAVGYGRTRAGSVGNGVGVNVYPLMKVEGDRVIAAGIPATLKKTGRHERLANTQGHHSMEGRKIVVEATLAEYLKDKAANNHNHHVWSIWSGHQYNGHKWGMTVDLNSCNGCGSCIVACQSENNIPVVGKKYVIQGREMHWLRIDRYYVGDPDNAEVVFQPVMCQQCDNAPCETVCPVLATSHSDEGLNDMVYNRCVGTRYCANNCPYKVRRFNWFNYTKKIEKPLHLALNPDVTVRSRGVMEKCTFCVHRIKYVKNVAKLEKRELKTDEVSAACQDSCAAGAMVFGDLNDPNSKVSKLYKSQRAYALLEEFGAAPSVRYLTKIRNNGEETRFKDGGHQGGHA